MPTTIVNQTAEKAGGPSSVLMRARREHGEQEALSQRLVTTSHGAQTKALTWPRRRAFTYARAEEAVVRSGIPVMSDDGNGRTLHIEQGHQRRSELTADLDRTGPRGCGNGATAASCLPTAVAGTSERCRPATCPDAVGPVGSAPVADLVHQTHQKGTRPSDCRVENCLGGRRRGLPR